MRGGILAVAALLVAGICALWLSGSAASGGGDATASLSPANERDPASAAARASQPTASQPRTAISEPSALGVAIRVVSFATRRPIAGAELRYQTPDVDLSKVTMEFEAYLREFGKAATSDDSGVCRLVVRPPGIMVFARSGGAFGKFWVSPEQPEVELVLREDHDLRVLLLTASGLPVPGVQLVAERVAADAARAARIALGKTDDQGRVCRRHAQELAGQEASYPVRLLPSLPGLEYKSDPIDLAVPPPEVILRLPAGGSVTVRLLEASGEPRDPRYLHGGLSLTTLDERPKSRSDESQAFHQSTVEAAFDARGIARFPCVALGKYVVVRLDSVERKGFEGPTMASPDIDVALQTDPAAAIVTARLLGPDGAAVAEGTILAECRWTRGMRGNLCRTDERGNLRWNLGPDLVGSVGEITFATGTETTQVRKLALDLPVRASLRPGIQDLGDLQLREPRVLVSGSIVHDPGTEMADPQIQVERRQEDRWEQLWNLQPEFRGRDRFELRGSIPEGEPLRLVFGSGPYLPLDPIECRVGTTGLEIRLRAAPQVDATFLVDEDSSYECLVPRLVRAGAGRGNAGMPDLPLHLTGGRDQGRVVRTWKALSPGTYLLTVCCPGSADPLVSIDGINVTSGRCDDTRLAGIDLRGKLRRLQVRVTTDDGRPIPDHDAFVMLRPREGSWQGIRLDKGVAAVVAPGAVSLTVAAPGYLLAEANDVNADCTIPLRRAPEIPVTIAVEGSLPEQVELSLQFTPQLGISGRTILSLDGGGRGVVSFLTESVAYEAGRRTVVSARAPGTYGVRAVITRAGSTRYVDDLQPSKVILDESQVASGIKIRVLQKGIAEALRSGR